MSLDVQISDGGVSPRRAKISHEGSLQIVEQPAPPYGGEQVMRVFRQFLTADGTSSGSSDMRVNGSSTNVEFWVPANLSEDKDRYITVLSFVIADAGQTLSEFGNLNAALTNGCQLEYIDENGPVTIHGALKTNFNFIRLCLGTPAFGDAAGAFRASNVSGTSEGYIPFLDLRKTFGFKWGVLLRAGSRQKIVLRVRDDLTGVDQFDCIAYGFERAKT